MTRSFSFWTMSATWSSHDSAAGFLRATQSACDSGQGTWREGDRPLSTFGYGRRSVAATLGWATGATYFPAMSLAVCLVCDDGRVVVLAVSVAGCLAMSTSMALPCSICGAGFVELVRPWPGGSRSIVHPVSMVLGPGGRVVKRGPGRSWFAVCARASSDPSSDHGDMRKDANGDGPTCWVVCVVGATVCGAGGIGATEGCWVVWVVGGAFNRCSMNSSSPSLVQSSALGSGWVVVGPTVIGGIVTCGAVVAFWGRPGLRLSAKAFSWWAYSIWSRRRLAAAWTSWRERLLAVTPPRGFPRAAGAGRRVVGAPRRTMSSGDDVGIIVDTMGIILASVDIGMGLSRSSVGACGPRRSSKGVAY